MANQKAGTTSFSLNNLSKEKKKLIKFFMLSRALCMRDEYYADKPIGIQIASELN